MSEIAAIRSNSGSVDEEIGSLPYPAFQSNDFGSSPEGRMVAVEPYLFHLVLVSAFRTPFFEPSRAGAFEIPTARAVVLVSKGAS
ncbi:hypothetical protein HZH66_002975 [Vespula vulgaris]|uniref:Uncharacterized protein n=1 Tax=Vespula vulgaris TaxID=7454 RepID=A0A834NI92_VESVU|nr:hypothetical protein HZH66_002975 [Vespula vulgaris]